MNIEFSVDDTISYLRFFLLICTNDKRLIFKCCREGMILSYLGILKDNIEKMWSQLSYKYHF